MAEQPVPELLRDPVAYARLLKDVHEAVLTGVPAARPPRPVISESWNRALAAHVDPDKPPPPRAYSDAELDVRRTDHPLSAVLPILRETLVSIARAAEHIMIVTDADGYILWCEGASEVRRQADRVNLAEGTRWSEDAIGTNAMGTALATGEPVQIYSAEHLVRTYHTWTCAAAPLRDPDTGTLLGTVDVSGPLHTVHPATLALVSATARLAEGHLRARLAARDEHLRRTNMPHLDALGGEPGALLSASGRVLAANSCGTLPSAVDVRHGDGTAALPDGRLGTLEPLREGFLLRLGHGPARGTHVPKVSLQFLGDGDPVVTLDGREIPISLRHAEILTLLALQPNGLSAERLALQLYGETGNPVTVRAEMHRLRGQLGSTVIHTRPYRLAADTDADFLHVRSALRSGAAPDAVRAFNGPLLPNSEAPAIRDERESLTAPVRRAALNTTDAETLWKFWNTSCGIEDAEVAAALCHLLPASDPRRTIVLTHLARLEP